MSFVAFNRKLTAFSLLRNHHRLFNDNRWSESKDLRFLDTIRFLSMFCVMLGHSAMTHSVLPLDNPQFIEKVSEHFCNKCNSKYSCFRTMKKY